MQPEARTRPETADLKVWRSLERQKLLLSKDITATYQTLAQRSPGTIGPQVRFESKRLFERLLECGVLALRAKAQDAALALYGCALALNPNSRAANWGMAQSLARPAENERIVQHLRIVLDSGPGGVADAANNLLISVQQETALRLQLARTVRTLGSRKVPRKTPNGRAVGLWARVQEAQGLGDHEAAAYFCGMAVDAMSDDQLIEFAAEISDIAWAAKETEISLAITRALCALREKHSPDQIPRVPFRAFNLYDLREYVFGKRVCLVANSGALRGSGMGAFIDGHDIVVRFNSFAIIPEDTGARTDIHAAIHKHSFNLEVPVHLRLIFSGDPKAWRIFMRTSITPSAQDFVGDISMRWPVRDAKLVNDRSGLGLPTSGFNMLRLLHFLGVCGEINLVGFDFYREGILRVPEAEALPLAEAHNVSDEELWILQRQISHDGITRSIAVREPEAVAVAMPDPEAVDEAEEVAGVALDEAVPLAAGEVEADAAGLADPVETTEASGRNYLETAGVV